MENQNLPGTEPNPGMPTAQPAPPTQPPQQVAPPTPAPVQSLYPTATQGIAGRNPETEQIIAARQAYDPSQPAAEGRLLSEKMPTGVYVIAGLLGIGVLLSLFDHSSYLAVWRQIAMVLNLLLAVGLLTRSNLARRVLIVLCALGVVLFGFTIERLINAQMKVESAIASYESAISNYESRGGASPSTIASLRQSMDKLRSQINRTLVLSYAAAGAGFAEDVIIVIYLTRPKVKAIFR